MKGVFATVFSITIVIVGITALSATGAAQKAASRSLTWHFVEKQIGFNFIGNPPRQGFNEPPLIGDQFAFTSDVLTRSGAHKIPCNTRRSSNGLTTGADGLRYRRTGPFIQLELLKTTSRRSISR